MRLEYEFEYHAELKRPVDVGLGPYGTRMFFEATDGEVTGERISGRLLTGGGDWVLMGPDGWGRLDVRILLQTHDGRPDLRHLPRRPRAQRVRPEGAGRGWCDPLGGPVLRVTPRLETGDERYGWVNRAVFVAEGRIHPVGVQYRVYRVT
jgi:hypothetical protein